MRIAHWTRLAGVSTVVAWLGASSVAGCSSSDSGASVTPLPACVAGPTIHGSLSTDWALAFGDDYVGMLAVDPNGGIVVTGSFTTPLTIGTRTLAMPIGSSYATFVLKLDSRGEVIWEHVTATPGTPAGVAVDGGGNVYVATSTRAGVGPEQSPNAVAIDRYDSAGNLLSSRTLRGLRVPYSSTKPLAVSAAGDIAVAALAVEFNELTTGARDQKLPFGAVMVFDASGQRRWIRAFDVDDFSQDSVSVDFDAQGRVGVAGTFTGTLDWGAPPLTASSSAFAAKLDTDGSVLWQKSLGDFSSASGIAAGSASLVGASFRGVAAVGDRQASAQGLRDLLFVAVDDQGGTQYLTTVAAGGDQIAALARDQDGGFLAAGSMFDYLDFGGGILDPSGVFLAKLDASGHHVFSARFASAGAGATAVAVDREGAIVVLGYFSDAIDLGTGVLRTTQRAQDRLGSQLFLARLVEHPAPPSASSGASCVPTIASGDASPALVTGKRLGYPEVLALQGDDVYWATRTEILRAPMAGGALPAVMARGQKGIADLVVDERALYWTARGTDEDEGPGNDGAILMQPLQGGEPVALADHLDAPRSLAVDAGQIYWTAGRELATPDDLGPGVVMSIPVSGGTPALLATGAFFADAIAARNGVVVFGQVDVFARTASGVSTRIVRLDPSGESRVLATTDHYVETILIDDVNVYWLDASTQFVEGALDDGRIRLVPLAGGDAVVLADRQFLPRSLTKVGDDLLWASDVFESLSGTVWRMPRIGGTPVAEIDHVGEINLLAADAARLAWIEFPGTGSSESTLRIHRR